MRIDNLYAIQAQNYVKETEKKKKASAEKLATGYKINRAADDAAGVAISEKMRKQIRGLNKASSNLQEGISAVQIADGAMAEVHDMLGRGLELSIEAANGTLSDSDRAALQQEIEQIKSEIDQIAEKAYYNELKVLKGSEEKTVTETGGRSSEELIYKGELPDWVGIDSGSKTAGYMKDTFVTYEQWSFSQWDPDTNETIEGDGTAPAEIEHPASRVDFSNYSASNRSGLYETGFHFTCGTGDNYYSVNFTKGTDSSMEMSGEHYIYNVGIDGVSNGADLVQHIIEAVDNGNSQEHYAMMAKDPQNPNTLVVYDNRSKQSYEEVIDSLWLIDSDNTTITWRDWGHSDEFSTEANEDYGKFGAGVAAYSEAVEPSYTYAQAQSIVIQSSEENGVFIPVQLPVVSCQKLGISDVDIGTMKGALAGIDSFKNASGYISEERSRCGSYYNRMEHSTNYVDIAAENTTAWESRIRDTDMVTEHMNLMKSSILEQAGQAVLAQANSSYEDVLDLLSF